MSRFAAAACAVLLACTACADPPSAAALRAEAKAAHKRALAEKNPEQFDKAHQLYQQYLSRYAAEPDAAMIAFFDGEALVRLQRWADAAKAYERSLALAPQGPRVEEIAYDYVIATKKAVDYDARQTADAGPRCPGAAPCAIPAPVQQMLRAFDRYLALVSQSKERPAIEYRRARIYYDYNRFDQAAPLFDAIVTRHPQHELAVYAANLELDCLGRLKRYPELRAAVARFKQNPAIMRDATAQQQIETLERELKSRP